MERILISHRYIKKFQNISHKYLICFLLKYCPCIFFYSQHFTQSTNPDLSPGIALQMKSDHPS